MLYSLRENILIIRMIMKFKILSFAVSISILFCGSALASQEELVFKNQRGSLLEIKVLDDNRIEGVDPTS